MEIFLSWMYGKSTSRQLLAFVPGGRPLRASKSLNVSALAISRFFPQYKYQDRPPTPSKTLEKAYQIGKDAGLQHIYIGNIDTPFGQNTYCPACQKVVIERQGYGVWQNNIKRGKCPECGAQIAGVF